MNKLFESMKEGLPTHELIECIENVLALIYLYQPFYDGNRRSCLILQKILYEREQNGQIYLLWII